MPVFILLAVVIIGVLLMSQQRSRNTHATPQKAGWSRYENTDYDLTFQYPSGWTVTRNESKDGRLAVELSNDVFGSSQLYFRVLKKSDSTIDAWKKRMTTDDPEATTPNYIESKEVTISGLSAWQLTASENNLNGDVTGVIISGHLYDLRLMTDPKHESQKSELNAVYQQVLETIEL